MTLANQVTLSLSTGGQPLVTTGSPITFTGTTTTNGVDVLYVNNTTTFAGPVVGSGGLTLSGTGNLVLTAANTYTGTTIVNCGTLTLSGNGTALSSSSLHDQPGGHAHPGQHRHQHHREHHLERAHRQRRLADHERRHVQLPGQRRYGLEREHRPVDPRYLRQSGQSTISSTNGAAGSTLSSRRSPGSPTAARSTSSRPPAPRRWAASPATDRDRPDDRHDFGREHQDQQRRQQHHSVCHRHLALGAAGLRHQSRRRRRSVPSPPTPWDCPPS